MATKDVSDGCADKVGLASDGGLISGAHLLPLVIATFPLLISNVFLHTWLGLRPVGRGGFCQEKEDENALKEVKWPKVKIISTDNGVKLDKLE